MKLLIHIQNEEILLIIIWEKLEVANATLIFLKKLLLNSLLDI